MPENVSAGATIEAVNADLAVGDDGTVHVVWREDEAFVRSIFYAEKRNGAWLTPEEISSGFDGSFPRVQLDAGGSVYVVWTTSSTPDDVIFAERPANGKWLPALNLTASPGNSGEPFLLIDEALLEMFYTDRPPGEDSIAPPALRGKRGRNRNAISPRNSGPTTSTS